MLIFALHVKTDRKLTAVNKITRNLFLRQPKGINYQISKEQYSNIDKRITKQTYGIYWFKPKLLSCQPIINTRVQIVFCSVISKRNNGHRWETR